MVLSASFAGKVVLVTGGASRLKRIRVGHGRDSIAISPNGATAYVTNVGADTVTPIALATHTPGTAIRVGHGPDSIAITPNGATAYVANADADTVTPIVLATKAGSTGRAPPTW